MVIIKHLNNILWKCIWKVCTVKYTSCFT